MGRERLAKAMIEPLLDKALRDINDDPARGLRNIIDLALNFPSGRFSKNLFKIVQKMLSDLNSGYYDLIIKISEQVNMENFKEFAMNIGYNSCTAGAKKLREKEEELGFPIPWSISIYSSRDEKWTYYIDSLISQGMEMGIYLYPVFGAMSFDKEMLDIFRKYKECAFVVLVKAFDVTEERLDSFEGIDNVLISITSDEEEELKAASTVLRNHRRFFAAHAIYNAENADELVKPETLKFYEDFTNSFLLYIPEINCPKETCDMMKTTARKIRDEQKYAFILMDLRGDLMQIDSIISGGADSFGFRSDGTIVTINGIVDGVKPDLKEQNLTDTLILLHENEQNRQ